MAGTRPTFRVFVSSSFRDLKIERDVLQNRVFPQLRQFCESRGARFQAIDLRWGISQEAGENQQTMNICLEELFRCQRITPRPNFIVLLGDRYGWQPLPAQIFEDEFQRLLDALRAVGAKEGESLLTAWYRLDENSVPRELVLRPRMDNFDENLLRSALQCAANGAFPPPAQISEQEFQQLLAALGSPRSRRDRQLLECCYRLDEQTVPQQRVLGFQNDEFNVDLLCRALQRAEDATQRARNPEHWPGERWKFVDPRRDKYFDSATHQEIRHGAFQAEDAAEHGFCYFRNIDPLQFPAERVKIDDGYKDYFDVRLDGTWDGAAHDRLEGLKDELCQRFGDQVREYNVPSFDDTEWHEQVAKAMVNDLRGVIEDELKKLEVTDPELVEAAPHVRFGQERSQHFTGRDAELDRIAAYVDDRGNRQPLVISGVGGSGKTALMAEAATRLGAAHGNAVLITRYIGATPASSDVRSLLQSLCQQIRRQYAGESRDAGQDASSSTESGPQSGEYQELVREFEKCLGLATYAKPLVVVLDALDQLNPTEGAQYLGWIPWRELPEHAKVVASVLKPGSDVDTDDDPARISYRVATSRVPEHTNIVPLGSMSHVQADQLLDKWLERAGRRLSPWEYPDKNAEPDGIRRVGRTLTAEQRKDVLDKFAVPENGMPLWLKLAFEEAKRWKSYDGLPTGHTGFPGLSDNIADILGDLFTRLQRADNHGEHFLRRALGYLAAGRRGLTEDELIDVLSSDKDVMNDFIARSMTEKEQNVAKRLGKLPVLIWSRLYSDLEPYLTERTAFGTTVLSFYHRQVADEVRKRYCAGDDEIHAHRLLAKYFGDNDARPYFFESLEEQRARAQRLPPTPQPVNVRKVDELPYHLIAAGDSWGELAKTMCNFEFLEAKLLSRMALQLRDDFEMALRAHELPSVARVQEAVLATFATLCARSHLAAQTLYNHLIWTGAGDPIVAQSLEAARHRLMASQWWILSESPPTGKTAGVEVTPFPISSSIQSLAPSRRSIAVAGIDGSAVILDVSTGAQILRRAPDRHHVKAVLLRDDCELIFVHVDGSICSEFGTDRIAGRSGESLLAQIPGRGVVLVRADHSLVVWNPESTAVVTLAAGLPEPLVALRVNRHGGRVLYVAGQKAQQLGTVLVGETDSTWMLPWTGPRILDAGIDPTGRYLALSTLDRRLRILDTQTWGIIEEVPYEEETKGVIKGPVQKCRLAPDPDSCRVLFLTPVGQVAVWDWKKKTIDRLEDYASNEARETVALLEWISPPGRGLLSTSMAMKTFVARSGSQNRQQHDSAVTACAIAPGSRVVSIGEQDHSVRWFDCHGLRPLGEAYCRRPTAMAMTDNPDIVYVGTEEGFVWKFILGSQEPTAELMASGFGPIASVLFESGGAFIVADQSGSTLRGRRDRPEGTVLQFTAPRYRHRKTLAVRGNLLVSWGEDHLIGGVQTVVSLLRGEGVALAPRRPIPATWADQRKAQAELALYTSSDILQDVAISPDGSRLCLAGLQVEVRSVTPRRDEEIYRRSVAIVKAAFLTDDLLAVALDNQKWIEIWCVCTDLPTLAAIDIEGPVSSLDARGDWLVVGSKSGQLRSACLEGSARTGRRK